MDNNKFIIILIAILAAFSIVSMVILKESEQTTGEMQEYTVTSVNDVDVIGHNATGGGFHLKVDEIPFNIKEGDKITITWDAVDPNMVKDIELID